MKSLCIGIVGSGAIGREHCLSLCHLPQVSEMLFFDAAPERARVLAEEFAGRSTSSLEKLIQNCDIVWICTPPFARREVIEKACKANKPIFCEKPLALSQEELEWTRRQIQSSTAPFFMGQSGRWARYFQKMQELAQDGAVGEIVSVWSTRLGWLDVNKHPAWRFNDNLGGGTLVELGIHEIDFIRWVGGECQSVYATASSKILVPGEFQDTVSVLGTLQSGASLRLDVSWACPRYLWQRGVEGTQGSLFFDDSNLQVVLNRPLKEPKIFPGGDWQVAATGENLSFTNQAQNILNAFLQGSPPPVTLQDGARAVEIALAIRASARDHAVVEITS